MQNCATPTKDLSNQSKLSHLLLKISLTSTERKASCVKSQLPTYIVTSNTAKSSKCPENSNTVCTENISKHSANFEENERLSNLMQLHLATDHLK